MRKKTVKCLCDNVFWYLIYLLPLILMFGVTFETGTFVSISQAMQSVGLNVLTENVIYTSLNQIFGTGGIVPLFVNADVIAYMTYFVSVTFLHLFVDIILVLPRYAMNLFDGFIGGKNND